MAVINEGDAALEAFLEARAQAMSTGCPGPDFTVAFVSAEEGQGAAPFTVAFHGGMAKLELGGHRDADHTVRYRTSELVAVIGQRRELLGPFWADHLPLDRMDWGPALYAFFYGDGPYEGVTPALKEIYLDPRYWPTVTPPTQGHRLYRLTAERDLRRTLEIGLAYGGSALFFLSAHAERGDGQHIALDPFQQQAYGNAGLDVIRRSGLEKWFHFEPVLSRPGLRALAQRGEVVDLAYVDGDHTVWGVLSDVVGVDALLRPGGFLAFDDSHFPSGREALRVIADQFDYAVLPDWSTDRLTVLQKVSQRKPPSRLHLRIAAGRARGKLGHEARRIAKRLPLVHRIRSRGR